MRQKLSQWFEILQSNYSVDLRSLALFRIALALIILVDLWFRSWDLNLFYTDTGAVPRTLLQGRTNHLWLIISPHLWSGDAWFQTLLFIITGVAALALLLGYRTKLSIILSWFLLMSLQVRNPLVIQAGDIELRILLFWGMFLPLGARWSVDNLLKIKPCEQHNEVFSGATIAISLQIAIIYISSALLKSGPEWRTDGTAIYYALHLGQLVKLLGQWLLHYPALMKDLTFSVWWLELLGPLLLLLPLCIWPIRLLGIVLFFLMHVGIGLTMALEIFPWVCISSLIAFIPSQLWEKLRRFLPTQLNLPNPFQDQLASVPQYPIDDKSSKFYLWSHIACLVLIFYVLLWNIRTVDNRIHYSAWFDRVGQTLGIDQFWGMFSPAPPKANGWFVMPGVLMNQQKVDLFREGKPITWQKPLLIADMYKTQRWKKYLGALLDDSRLPPYFAHYLCTSWNHTHQSFPAEKLKSLEVDWMQETVLPNDKITPVKKYIVIQYACPSKG